MLDPSAGRRLASDPFDWSYETAPEGINNMMHGHWEFEYVSTSDRSLKDNIVPLMQSLQNSSSARGLLGLGWESLLEQLRPVSYHYTGEAQTRFGFIAQDMEATIPEVTFTRPSIGGRPDRKGIMYMDLVAVLMALAKGMFEDMATLTAQLTSVETRIKRRRAWKARRRREARRADGRSPTPR